MDELKADCPSGSGYPTIVERKSDREMVAKRVIDAPAHVVFEAWTKPELFQRWWLPKSMGMTMVSCVMDVRTGGHYRLEIGHPALDQPAAFFGRYLEVTPPTLLVWTNEENADGNVTTVTFEESEGKTLVTFHELYPTKEALDEEGSATEAMSEQFEQLNALVISLKRD